MAIVGEGDRWEEYTRRGGEIAVQARDGLNPEAYVAGGFAPPYDGDLREEFEGQARVLAEAGVDVMLPEYMAGASIHDTSLSELCHRRGRQCGDRAPRVSGPLRPQGKRRLQHGETFEELAAALQGHRVDAVLLMCSDPQAISACLPNLRATFDGPIGAYANIGYEAILSTVPQTTRPSTRSRPVSTLRLATPSSPGSGRAWALRSSGMLRVGTRPHRGDSPHCQGQLAGR